MSRKKRNILTRQDKKKIFLNSKSVQNFISSFIKSICSFHHTSLILCNLGFARAVFKTNSSFSLTFMNNLGGGGKNIGGEGISKTDLKNSVRDMNLQRL